MRATLVNENKIKGHTYAQNVTIKIKKLYQPLLVKQEQQFSNNSVTVPEALFKKNL